MSNIYSVEKTEAQNFVAELMHEEEAVGAVTSVDQYGASGSLAHPQKHSGVHASPRVSTSSAAAAMNKLKVQETLLEEEEEEGEEELTSEEEEEVQMKRPKKGSKPPAKSKAIKTRYTTG